MFPACRGARVRLIAAHATRETKAQVREKIHQAQASANSAPPIDTMSTVITRPTDDAATSLSWRNIGFHFCLAGECGLGGAGRALQGYDNVALPGWLLLGRRSKLNSQQPGHLRRLPSVVACRGPHAPIFRRLNVDRPIDLTRAHHSQVPRSLPWSNRSYQFASPRQ